MTALLKSLLIIAATLMASVTHAVAADQQPVLRGTGNLGIIVERTSSTPLSAA